jgi:hypothetical protein
VIKIEVRIRSTVDNLSVEHEYRAELPDDATADQIKAVGAEAEKKAQVILPEPEQVAEVPTAADGLPVDLYRPPKKKEIHV